MQSIADLKLHSLPMADPAFSADPWPELAKAREAHPWLAACDFGHVVHQYDAMRDLLWLDHSLTGAYHDVVEIMEAEGTPWGRFQHESLLAQTGDSHKRIRSVLAPAFTPQQANKHRALMQQVIAQLLDEWVPKGEFDFEDFASFFPITVMCSLIGAPTTAIASLRSSMEAFGLSMSMDKRVLPRLNEATLVLDAFAREIVAERRKGRKAPGEEDMLEVLINTLDDGKLSERELYDLLIFLFVAGYDTSKNMLTLTMQLLIDRPEIYRRCAEDHAFARSVVEESFRYGSTTSNQRVLNEEIEYRDVVLEKDAIVWFPLSVATHDPRYAEHADTFDPGRQQKNPHIGFGLGPHICLGQYIARAQIHEGLHLIAQRLLNPRTPGPEGYRPFPGTWGLRGLPIEFDLPDD